MDFSYLLDSRFRGNDTPPPTCFDGVGPITSGGRGELPYSANILPRDPQGFRPSGLIRIDVIPIDF
jgi:hypothetical protein